MKARVKMKVQYARDYLVVVPVQLIVENARNADEAEIAARDVVRDRLKHLEFHLAPIERANTKGLDPRRFPE